MKITNFNSNNAIINELGQRIKSTRISQSLTQEDIYKLSGVSLATIKGIEKGNGFSVETLIKVLKALNLCSNLNDLIPINEISPLDISKKGVQKQRVYKRKQTNKIIWGEDK